VTPAKNGWNQGIPTRRAPCRFAARHQARCTRRRPAFGAARRWCLKSARTPLPAPGSCARGCEFFRD
jgi:hypothetical protein